MDQKTDLGCEDCNRLYAMTGTSVPCPAHDINATWKTNGLCRNCGEKVDQAHFVIDEDGHAWCPESRRRDLWEDNEEREVV